MRRTRFLFTGILLSVSGLFQGCSIVFPIIAPFNDLPAPTGPFEVGTRIACWTDSSRDETFTAEPDFRRLVVQVWFPISEAPRSDPVFYVDEPDLRMPALAKQMGLPLFLIQHFSSVKTNTYAVDTREVSEAQFPLLIFSHGLSGMRYQNSALMEELASHGYVVMAADHSYEANITIFPDGSTADYRGGNRRGILRGASTEHLDFSQLSIIVDDMRFLIDRVHAASSDPMLGDLGVDIEQLGLLGHSLGGAAIMETAVADPRVDAVMVLDGWYIPLSRSAIKEGLETPFFHLGQKIWRDRRNYVLLDQLILHSRGPVFKLLIPNTMHPDYTDMPLFSPFSRLIGYTAVRNPLWLNALIRGSSLDFFNAYLKGADKEIFILGLQSVPGVTSYAFAP